MIEDSTKNPSAEELSKLIEKEHTRLLQTQASSLSKTYLDLKQEYKKITGEEYIDQPRPPQTRTRYVFIKPSPTAIQPPAIPKTSATEPSSTEPVPKKLGGF